MQRRAVKDAIWGEMKGIKIPTQMQWSWKTVWIYVSHQLLYFCVGFSVFKQNKSHVWRLTSQSMLGFSWISGCMEISHSTWRLPCILGAEPHMERKKTRKRETCKILHSKLHSYSGSTVSPATATSLRFISMVSNSSGKYGIRIVRGNTNKNRQVFQ